MNKKDNFDKELQDLSQMARGLAHPARLAILRHIASQDSCVSGDISSHVPLSRSTVSQHLKELRDLGIIHGEIEGTTINYCLCSGTIAELSNAFAVFFSSLSLSGANCNAVYQPLNTYIMKVLILCTGNSCRSQMAHGFLQSFDSRIGVFSAGTQASGKLNAGAVAAMSEIGIDISGHSSDSVEKYLGEEWDYVITVCGGANEACPAFIGKVGERLHIGFDDPSHAEGTEDFIKSEFRRVRDEIKEGFYAFYKEKIAGKL
jgi:arsenate reductase (thioredoxin)